MLLLYIEKYEHCQDWEKIRYGFVFWGISRIC